MYIRALYKALPAGVTKRLRAILEFDGGVADTHLLPAQKGVDTFNIITQGRAEGYRAPPRYVRGRVRARTMRRILRQRSHRPPPTTHPRPAVISRRLEFRRAPPPAHLTFSITRAT
jgi:hypothetical protein